jgi:endonuclease YncB( thermonuclease family)
MLVRGRVWTLLVIGALLGAGVLFQGAPAQGQERHAATVTSVVDGDTLNAQVAGGPALEIQLIGIDAPEPGDCGGGEATEHLKQLALGRSVTLVSDPTLEQFESPGSRPLFYVDRDDGFDVGLEMVRAGWADIWFLSDFQRSSAYLSPAAEAERLRYGVWSRCGGDFHFNRADELRQRRRQAPDLERWSLTRHGFGRLNVGLTRDKIERRAGRSLRFVYKVGPCAIWRIRGVRGIWIMTIRGRLARVDLGRRPWRTSLGIRVGDSESKVRDRYPRARARKHAYDPDGQYLILPGRHRRVVFETNGKDEVTAIRGGRMPAVMYVEGCA